MPPKEKTFFVRIHFEECKGCRRCIEACPKKVLSLGVKLNSMGFPYANYSGEGCVGCGACFYNCPEPGAITIIEEGDNGDGE